MTNDMLFLKFHLLSCLLGVNFLNFVFTIIGNHLYPTQSIDVSTTMYHLQKIEMIHIINRGHTIISNGSLGQNFQHYLSY